MLRVFVLFVCTTVVFARSKYLGLDTDELEPHHHHHHHHNNKHHHHKTNNDFVSYDEEGKGYVRCMVNKDGEKYVRQCAIPEGKNAEDMGYACYALWTDDQLTQGCWIHQTVSLESQCQKKACTAKNSPLGVNFCCCFGHECNAEYGTD